MNYAAHIQAEEAHTRRLAALPGWREYVKDKADRMARWQPALYAHLPQIVADTPLNPQEPECPRAHPTNRTASP